MGTSSKSPSPLQPSIFRQTRLPPGRRAAGSDAMIGGDPRRRRGGIGSNGDIKRDAAHVSITVEVQLFYLETEEVPNDTPETIVT